MPNKTAEKIVRIRKKLWLQSASAHVSIKKITDDQHMLWLASDALEQAEADLQWAIADSTNTVSANELRLQLIAIAGFKQYVALLHLLPPQTLVLPLVVGQLALMFFGTWWLLFGIHLNYWLVMPFVIGNLIAHPYILTIPDQHVIAILDKATELAESTHHKYVHLQTHSE